MKLLGFGLVALLVGILVCGYGLAFNATPRPAGPVPVIGGFLMAVVGLLACFAWIVRLGLK